MYENDLLFNEHLIKRNEKGDWLSLQVLAGEHASQPFKIANEKLDEKLILPYAATFQLLLNDRLDLIYADVPELDGSRADYTGKQKLRVQGALILGVFFLLLLVNFILFSTLNTENAQLLEQSSRTSQGSEELERMTSLVKDKEAQLKNLGWDGGISKSHMIDELAAILPENVYWNTVEINPVDIIASRQQKSVKFLERTIKVNGTAERILNLNEWMAIAKTKKWVKEIRLDNYSFNQEENTGLFTVLINY